MIKKDLHVHLHGCLTAQQLWTLGRDSYKKNSSRLEWYASEYQKAWGRKPQYKDYWESDNGFESLKKDFLFLEKNNFKKFQANFNLIIALCPIRFDDFIVQKMIVKEVSEHKLEYFEARTLIPFYFQAKEAHQYLIGLCQTVQDLNKELHMTTKLVFSLFRENSLALKHYHWIRQFMAQHPVLAQEIQGIDFAYTEECHPPKNKVELFKKLHQDNLSLRPLDLLYHVGESFTDKGLKSAIRWIMEAQELGTTRLGHAIALGIDPDNYQGQKIYETKEEHEDTVNWLIKNETLLKKNDYFIDHHKILQEKKELKDKKFLEIKYDSNYREDTKNLQEAVIKILKSRNTLIESCPTSNLRVGEIKKEKYHPLKRFKASGLKTVIATDDPGILNINWKSENERAQKICLSKS